MLYNKGVIPKSLNRVGVIFKFSFMEMLKLKLEKLDITPMSDRELSKVLGGFIAASSGGGSASTGGSVSASECNGADVDVTNDSDSEND